MLIRNAIAFALASLMLANCATAPGEDSFCTRNTALCVVGGVAIAAVVAFALAVATGDKDRIGLASDLRLKQDVRPVGALPNGLQLYSFRYWNDDRTFVSVMAQDLLEDERFRYAVFEDENGYYLVHLEALGLDVAGSRSQFFEAGRRALAEAEPVAN